MIRNGLAAALCFVALTPQVAPAANVSVKEAGEIDAIAISTDFALIAHTVKKSKDLSELDLIVRERVSGKQVLQIGWDGEWGNPYRGFFSVDNKKLAVMGAPFGGLKTAMVFDLTSGDVIANLRHPQVELATLSPDGRKAVSAATTGAEQRLWLWDLGTRKKTVIESAASPTSVAFSPDGRLIAVGHATGPGTNVPAVSVCDASRRKIVAQFVGHEDRHVNSVQFSPDGTTVASAGRDGTVRLWDVNRKLEKQTFDEHLDEVFSVAFHPSGKLVASISKDKTLRFWQPGSNKTLLTLRLNLRSSYDANAALLFSADGKMLAVRKYPKITLWRIDFKE